MMMSTNILRHLVLVFLIGACCPVRVRLSPETPLPPHDPACMVDLLASDNYQDLTSTFSLKEETVVRIVGQFEGASYDVMPGLVVPILYDCMEVYFYVGSRCRLFRFVLGADLVSGNNTETESVGFAQGAPSPSRYVFEMAFPWEALGLKETPGEETVLPLDICVFDNDGEDRRSRLAWSGWDTELWRDWTQYGDFALAGHRTALAPAIDGIADAIWGGQELFPLGQVILGTVRDGRDLSAGFRTLWDEENLYMLVEVEDNVKYPASVLFDRGSLTDRNGNTVWRLDYGRSFHAGGALKNRRQEDTLSLPAGKYTLHYETDESHAPDHWDDLPPDDPFSGIKIYALDL